MSSTAFSGTPCQRALPIAPLPSWPPATRGVEKPRLLPEHWLTATSSTAFSFLMSFSDSFSGLSTLPLISSVNLSGIDVVGHVGEMVADEERVVRRDRAVVEDRERGLELRRPLGQADHRALLRVSHQRPFAIVERQRHGIERERPR